MSECVPLFSLNICNQYDFPRIVCEVGNSIVGNGPSTVVFGCVRVCVCVCDGSAV